VSDGWIRYRLSDIGLCERSVDFREDFAMPIPVGVADELQSCVVMSNSRSFACLLVVASLAIGCAESASIPTSPSSSGGSLALTAEQLAGTWNLVSLQSTGQAEEAKPSAATYTLTFDNGRLSTRVDCNVCSGAFELSGTTLRAGPALACTRAACPTMAFEAAYTSLLSGEITVTLADGVLVLSSPRGVLKFAR
jgi:heat shock protein HslJ